MTTRLPVVLENLRIAAPCSADWDDMSGDERVRFCGQCQKNVYNLSAMTRADAEALVREREGRVCVRLYQRADGTVITNDCPVGTRRQRLRQRARLALAKLAASAALLVGVATGRARADLTVDGSKKHPAPTPVKVNVLQGGPVAPPRPPVPLMGKIAIKAEPDPTVKMGEPRVIMGDAAVPTPPPPAPPAPTPAPKK